jgi:hypothetical protein
MKTRLLRYLSAGASLIRHEQWNIGLVHTPIHSLLELDALPKIEWLPSLRTEKYRADAFGLERDGRLFIFYELFNYRSFLGKLYCIELDNVMFDSVGCEILNLPYHASYPFILEYEGKIYCIPETKSANRIDMFVADEFPYKWTKVRTLLPNFSGVDPTIIKHNQLWYLFCGAGEGGHDLYIWYAEDPLGTWHSHRRNPVKSGDQRSRPGGTPFVHKGTLYRPAQDGSKTYGGGIIIYSIAHLSPDEFGERVHTTISPRPEWPYCHGLHTISAVGGITLIDAKRYVFSLGGLRHYAKRLGLKIVRRQGFLRQRAL